MDFRLTQTKPGPRAVTRFHSDGGNVHLNKEDGTVPCLVETN